MLSEENYNTMKDKYGSVGSWAIWRPAGDTPKSNTHDMSWVEDDDLLQVINTGFVFVGLNWSSTHGDQSQGGTLPWVNYHSSYSYQNDYKLRYAVTGTRYWGFYITDIIKLYAEVDSGKVKNYLRNHPEIVFRNVIKFEEEISLLGSSPVLVALGGDTYNILKKHLGHKFTIARIKHYSFTISKENYRKELIETLDKY